MKLLKDVYPELCDEMHEKYRIGMHAMLVESDVVKKDERDIIRNAVALGYAAGKRDMLAEAITSLHNLDEFKAASGDNESR